MDNLAQNLLHLLCFQERQNSSSWMKPLSTGEPKKNCKVEIIRTFVNKGGLMEKSKLEKKIAFLEFQNDQLIAELQYTDALLKKAGFSNGLNAVKRAAKEVIEGEFG